FALTPPALSYLYTLSLHDALPILLRQPMPDLVSSARRLYIGQPVTARLVARLRDDFNNIAVPKLRPKRRHSIVDLGADTRMTDRSEEHTSELQSRGHLVCRLLLEK